MRDRPLLGLLSLDLLYVIDNVLLIPILLALFVGQRRFDESVMAIGATIGFVGVAARWRALRVRRDFERSLAVVAPALAERYGARLTERLTDDARSALERLAARVPWVPGPRGVVFNGFLAITAQELAAFHAFRDHGHPPEDAWSWCHRALSERLARLPAWRRRLLARIMGSSATRRIVARRSRRSCASRT